MLIKVHHQDMYFYLSKRKNEIIKKEKKMRYNLFVENRDSTMAQQKLRYY